MSFYLDIVCENIVRDKGLNVFIFQVIDVLFSERIKYHAQIIAFVSY